MNNIFPINDPLTIVWHLSKPDGTPFNLNGYSYRLFYKNGKGKNEAASTAVTASGDTISFEYSTEMPRFTGMYALQLLLYQNNKLLVDLNYNDAFGFDTIPVSGSNPSQSQEVSGGIVHLYTVAEYYLLAPVVPVVGDDGFWWVNGERLVTPDGENVAADHTLEYDPATKYLIIDKGRVDAHGQSIQQTITDIADALSYMDGEEADRQEAEGQGDYSDPSEYPDSRRAKEAERQENEAARQQAEGNSESEPGDGSRVGNELQRIADEGTPSDEEGADTRWGAEKARRAAEGTPEDDPDDPEVNTRWAQYKRSIAATERANEAAAAAEHQVDVKRGYGIASVTEPVVSHENGGWNTIRVTTEDNRTYDFQVRNGRSSAGFFADAASLTAAGLTPAVGDYCFVSKAGDGTFPAYIYVCTTAGTWTATTAEFDGEGSIDLVDALNSDSTTAALTAKQGKVLDEKISQLGQEVVNAEIKAKGNQFDNLPIYINKYWNNQGSFADIGGWGASPLLSVVPGIEYKLLNATSGYVLYAAQVFDKEGTYLGQIWVPTSGTLSCDDVLTRYSTAVRLGMDLYSSSGLIDPLTEEDVVGWNLCAIYTGIKTNDIQNGAVTRVKLATAVLTELNGLHTDIARMDTSILKTALDQKYPIPIIINEYWDNNGYVHPENGWARSPKVIVDSRLTYRLLPTADNHYLYAVQVFSADETYLGLISQLSGSITGAMILDVYPTAALIGIDIYQTPFSGTPLTEADVANWDFFCLLTDNISTDNINPEAVTEAKVESSLMARLMQPAGELVNSPINLLVGVGTSSPSSPFSAGTFTGGGSHTVATIEADDDSPVGLLMANHKRLRFTNGGSTNGNDYIVNNSSNIATRGNHIEISMWVKDSEWVEIDREFLFIICFISMSPTVKQTYFACPIKDILDGTVYDTVYHTRELITSYTYSARKVNSSNGWSKIICDISNIVWVDDTSKYNFAIVLNNQQSNWTGKSFCISEPQITFGTLLTKAQRLQDMSGSITNPFPRTVKDQVDKNTSDIEVLNQEVAALAGEENDLTIVLDASGKTVKITSEFSETYNIENSMYWRDDEGYTYNPCANFGGTSVINKNNLQRTIVNHEGDNISASGLQNGWIGANHGLSNLGVYTVTGHDKTFADIGSKWNDGEHDLVLVRIKDENTLCFIPTYYVANDIPYFYSAPAAGTTLTHVSGATHTSSITLGTKGSDIQWYPSEEIISRHLYVDGKEITTSGTYKGKQFDLIEVYEVYNPADYLDILIAAAGTLTENPLPKNYASQLGRWVRYSNNYRFTKGGMNVLLIDWIVLDKVGFGQFFPLDVKAMNSGVFGGELQYYLPKSLPITVSGQDYDFRIPAAFNVPSSGQGLEWTSTYWENPLLPPDRAIEFIDNGTKRVIGLHHGYVWDQGVACGENRKDYCDRWWVYTSRASYTGALSSSKIGNVLNRGQHYGLACFRKYEDVSNNPAGLISLSQFEVNGKYYVYADFEASGEYELKIPAKWQGKELKILEKSNNVELISSMSVAPILAIVSTANPMYGYIVFEIQSNPQ